MRYSLVILHNRLTLATSKLIKLSIVLAFGSIRMNFNCTMRRTHRGFRLVASDRLPNPIMSVRDLRS
jgi:hypothetical protein